MCLIYDLAWRKRKIPDECKQVIIVTLHKGKGCKDECNNFKGISLLSVPEKVYGRVLTERLKFARSRESLGREKDE